jgi:protein required for attachment to host cells
LIRINEPSLAPVHQCPCTTAKETRNMPMHQLKLLFAIADGEHARFVRPDAENNTLRSASRVKPENGHNGAADQPHHDKDKFARWVAAQLNQDSDSYDELVLVAPAHTLAAIHNHLATPVQDKLLGTLDKDLTKIPDHELWPHLKQWVRPMHREKLI